jgi:hypothetical protein
MNRIVFLLGVFLSFLAFPAGAAILTADDVVALRAIPASSGPGNQVLLVSYVSGKGKGGGILYWDASATVADDNCLVFMPTGGGTGRWRRQVSLTGGLSDEACGVVDDGTTDDTVAIQRALALFTTGRTATVSGLLYHCGTSLITKPLIYGGSPTAGFVYQGCVGQARGLGGAQFVWGGTGFPAMFYFYGANQALIRDINFNPGASGNGLIEDVVVTADNGTNTTLAAAVTAGNAVTASVGAASNITIGRFIGVGSPSTGDFEIVQVLGVSGTAITANFQFNHASGEQVGGSAGSSGAGLQNVAGYPPTEAHTILSTGITAGGNVVITPAAMTNITVGMPIALGGVNATILPETVYVKSVAAGSFTADVRYNHSAGETITTATAFILTGNETAFGTDQVSETDFSDIGAYCQSSDYAGMRFIQAGNVKNHNIDKLVSSGCNFMLAFEGSSGMVRVARAIGSSTVADFMFSGTANFEVNSFETEDTVGSRLMIGVVPTAGSVVFNGGQWDGVAPADDTVIKYAGALSLRGMIISDFRNATSVPRIEIVQLFDPVHDRPGSIFSTGNYFQHATNFTPVFYQSGNPINYRQYPINSVGIPNLFSFGDYGDNGNLQPVFGQMAAMWAAPTIDGLSSGVVLGRIGQLQRTVSSVTIPYTAFQTGATTINLTALGIPPNMRVVGALANITTAFAGPAGTLNLRVGTTSGGQELLLDGDVKTAPIVLGDADAELGTCLARATAVQGGCTLPSLAAGSMFVRLTSGSGNLSGLTAGSVSLSLVLERLF